MWKTGVNPPDTATQSIKTKISSIISSDIFITFILIPNLTSRCSGFGNQTTAKVKQFVNSCSFIVNRNTFWCNELEVLICVWCSVFSPLLLTPHGDAWFGNRKWPNHCQPMSSPFMGLCQVWHGEEGWEGSVVFWARMNFLYLKNTGFYKCVVPAPCFGNHCCRIFKSGLLFRKFTNFLKSSTFLRMIFLSPTASIMQIRLWRHVMSLMTEDGDIRQYYWVCNKA